MDMIPKDLTETSCKFINEYIANVSLSNSRKNTFNKRTFEEIKLIFKALEKVENLRVILFTGEGSLFSAGLDLTQSAEIMAPNPDIDTARRSLNMYNLIKDWQESLSLLNQIRVPVIAGIHSHCIGAGIDLISAADIRYCTEDAKFTIKEVDIGICADIGTFPRIQMITGNESFVRELAYTGRVFTGKEALQMGFVSKVFINKKEMDEALLKLAKEISEKSPVAIYGIKKTMNSLYDSKTREVLEYVAMHNMGMIQTDDLTEAVSSFMQKKKPQFSKL